MTQFTTTLLTLLFATTLAAQINPGDVAINEFTADTDSLGGVADPDGGYPDWIELYNNTNQAIDLSNAYLSDKADDLLKWQFPAGTTIAADGYLIIWADEDLEQQGLHANFKLSRTGEAIYLSNADESRIDGVEFGELTTNQSLSRVPNGTGPFVAQHSTPLFSNTTPVSVSGIATAIQVTAYPNPARTLLNLEVPAAAGGSYSVSLFSAAGHLIFENRPVTGRTTPINVTALPQGAYLLRVTDQQGNAGTYRFNKL